MAIVGILIGIITLVVMAFIFLGWLLPLIIGLVRRKKGKSCTGLIIFGGVWGGVAAVLAAVMAFAVFSFMELQSSWQVEAFDASAYDGDTAAVVFPYKGGDAVLTASTEDDVNYTFGTSNGKFVVPAGTITPTSYSISLKDEQGKYWSAMWRFHSSHEDPLNCEADGEVKLDWAPPLVMKATRKGLADGSQKIGMKVVDGSGHEVNLSCEKTPVLQIIDESGKVVGKHTMEYG